MRSLQHFPFGIQHRTYSCRDNLVVVFLNQTGTHQGEFQGKPLTNKPVSIRSADLYKIENGKIVQHLDVVDQFNLLQQTGATFEKANQE